MSALNRCVTGTFFVYLSFMETKQSPNGLKEVMGEIKSGSYRVEIIQNTFFIVDTKGEMLRIDSLNPSNGILYLSKLVQLLRVVSNSKTSISKSTLGDSLTFKRLHASTNCWFIHDTNLDTTFKIVAFTHEDIMALVEDLITVLRKLQFFLYNNRQLCFF